ncbi:MAG TPA: M3 family metallopeptidase, partial [Polyangiaceae bacterium]|nr:M3 family metallopeptidase [Polyangiaceae bacterium]
MQDNPLLSLAHPIPFDRVRADHVEPAVLDLIAQSRAAIDAIATSADLSYAGTFQALETSTERLEIVMGVVEHLESVATSDALRDAYNKILPAVSQFYSSITLHAGLYQALCAGAKLLNHDLLSPIQQRYVQKTLDDFRRHGAELDDAGKQELKRIDQALSEKTTLFSQNVLDSTNVFEVYVDESRISGLPESALAMARESAAARGQTGYRFTLQAPSVTPVLNYADDAALREQVWRAFNQRGRGKYDNLPLIGEILALRNEKARLLGFKDFSDLVAFDRMAKTGEHAAAFVADLRLKTEAAYRRENVELLAYRR